MIVLFLFWYFAGAVEWYKYIQRAKQGLRSTPPSAISRTKNKGKRRWTPWQRRWTFITEIVRTWTQSFPWPVKTVECIVDGNSDPDSPAQAFKRCFLLWKFTFYLSFSHCNSIPFILTFSINSHFFHEVECGLPCANFCKLRGRCWDESESLGRGLLHAQVFVRV